MFHRLFKEAYFNKIKNITNFDSTPFYFLPKEFHDPTLDFSTRLYRYITENDKALDLNNKPWIGMLWTRSPVSETFVTTQYKGNKFVIFNGNTAQPDYDCYRFRNSAVKMSVVFYSNDPDYLEDFEENIFLDVPFNFPLEIIYPTLSLTQPLKQLVSQHQHTSIIKDPRENFGTLVKLQTDCIFNYVIPKQDGIIKGVKEINLDIVRSLDQAIADLQIVILK
jgi:hypothetical protein